MPEVNQTEVFVRLIARATGCPAAEARKRLGEEHRRLGTNVVRAMRERELEPHRWSAKLIPFYAETDAFLFESVAWNRSPAKCSMRRWIGDWLLRTLPPPARILLFGDGPGFDSLYLARAAYQVDYYEPSVLSVRFAELLFQGAEQPPRRIAAADEGSPYGAILCLDVLEHVPDPPDTVRTLAGLLRPGGYLIVHAPFFSTTADCPTHLRSNVRYCGNREALYSPAGLVPVDGRMLWNPIVLQKTSNATQPCKRSTRLRIEIGRIALGTARIWRGPHLLAAKYNSFSSERRLSKFL